jgi:hypothetical protein
LKESSPEGNGANICHIFHKVLDDGDQAVANFKVGHIFEEETQGLMKRPAKYRNHNY